MIEELLARIPPPTPALSDFSSPFGLMGSIPTSVAKLRRSGIGCLIEFILLTVYALVVSTILVLLSRPVRWAIRRVVGSLVRSTTRG